MIQKGRDGSYYLKVGGKSRATIGLPIPPNEPLPSSSQDAATPFSASVPGNIEASRSAEEGGAPNRKAELDDSGLLAKERVHIDGIGAVGGQIGMELLQNGVRREKVLDYDYVTAGNLGGRTVYRNEDLGKPKAAVYAEVARMYCVDADVESGIESLNRMTDGALLSWHADADLLVCAVDEPGTQERLNRLFYSRIPCIYPGVHRDGDSGHVIYTLPGLAPCLLCCLEIEDTSDMVQLRGAAAQNLDIRRVVHESVSVILSLLCQNQSSSPFYRQLWPDIGNFLFIDNRVASGNGLSWLGTKAKSSCPVCSIY